MQKRKIVLASKSPRRKYLLELIGLDFEIRESEYEEDMKAKKNPFELAKFLALKKAEDVAKYYNDAIIIGADGIIVFENEILGKPKDKDEAKFFLKKFSGKENIAYTGFAIIDTKTGKTINDYGKTILKFRNLSDEEIKNYVKYEEVENLAGGYKVHGLGGILFEKIEGDFFNAMGLPLVKVYLALKEMGVDVLKL